MQDKTETNPPQIELSRSEIGRLPLGYHDIHVLPILPKHIEDKILVRNAKFQSVATATGSTKPISKIVE